MSHEEHGMICYDCAVSANAKLASLLQVLQATIKGEEAKIFDLLGTIEAASDYCEKVGDFLEQQEREKDK